MKKKAKSANTVIILFIAMIAGGSFVMAGGIPSTDLNNPDVMTPTPEPVNIVSKNSSPQKALQLQTLPFTTIFPTPTSADTSNPQPTKPLPTPEKDAPTPIPVSGNFCSHGTVMTGQCECDVPHGNTVTHCSALSPGNCPTGTHYTGQPDDPYSPYQKGCVSDTNDPNNASIAKQPNCQEWCIAKPIVYLYPTHQTAVNVFVNTIGAVTISDPLYPSDGWKNVLAHPNGSLFYEGKTYHELFYETSVESVKVPDTGIIISAERLKETLSGIITQLGLSPLERDEFLSYWVPELKALHSPYILFSVLDQVEKNRTDSLEITPKPDTMISFIAYFKPLQFSFTTKLPLFLPRPQKRTGFTAVEWGGTIDRN